MRPVLLFVVAGASCLAVGGGSFAQVLAAEDSKDITRVAIAVSGGPVAYTDQFRQDPPAIVIEFRSRNVIAAMGSSMVINAGIIKEIQSEYYPPGRRALKSLTLTLVQPAAYSISQQANQIVIDIQSPPSLLPGRMAIGGGLTILGIEARETLISRLKAMGDALQQAAPPVTAESVKPKPVVVTKPVEIPKPVFQSEPKGEPVSKGGRGGFWPGVLLGIGGTTLVVAGRRRRRKAAVAPGAPAEVVPMAQGASVYEQLILKAVQRQGQKLIGSKAIEGLGAIWIVEKEGERHSLLCLIDGEFFERKVLEQFLDALKQETLPSGTVMALGAFTAPAQSFAKEKEISLISREEVFKLMEVELKSAALVLDEETLNQQLAKPQGELVQAQERIKALEQELSAHAEFKGKVKSELEGWEKETETLKKKLQESERHLGEERAKKQALEQQVAEFTQKLAAKDEFYAKLSQEADQLKAKSAEVDQRLAAEQEKRTQLETQIARLEEQLKVQASTVAEKEQRIQEVTEAAKDIIKAVAVEEPKAPQEVLLAPLETSQEASGQGGTQSLTGQGQEHRRWPRLDLSRQKGKGVLVRATSNDGEPMNGDAHNISAGGLCVELSSGEQLADEFELKLFLPDRTKPIEAIGKIVWKGRGSRRRMGQLGVAFSAVNAPDQVAISQFVEEQSLKPVSVG